MLYIRIPIAIAGLLTFGLLAQPAISQEAGGAGLGGGGEYGMEGMMGGMGGMARIEMQTVVTGADGKQQKLTSEIAWVFRYELGSLRPVERPTGEGYMGMMGGSGGIVMGGGGMGGDYGEEMGYDEGGYGGGGYAGGGYGGPKPGVRDSNQPKSKRISIWAFVFTVDGGRDKIELVVPFGDISKSKGRALAEKSVSLQSPGGPNGYALLSTAVQKADLMPEQEADLVSNIIRQSIWMKAAIDELNRNKTNEAEVARIENELRQLLTEEFDTQLARQELEISGIEERIVALRDELSRRKAAKARVVDVQLGNIVLEAQGLLGK